MEKTIKMNIMKIYYKRRAVSPVLAAILLIGLAVAAAAVLFVVVLPMIGGTAKVGFVSAVAADRNSDGLLDQITVQVSNSGVAADSFADGTISLTGWSTTGNVEIGLANPVDLIFKTTDVMAQIAEGATFTITLAFDSTADIVITETTTGVDMDHAATLTQSDMLMDWQDTETTRSNTTGTETNLTDVNAQHSGLTGIKMYADGTTVGGVNVSYYRHTDGATDDGTTYGPPDDGGRTKTDSPETWDTTATPVISFWIKSNIDVSTDGTNRQVWLYWETWDASTPTYEDAVRIDTAINMAGTQWNHVLIDLGALQNADDGDDSGALCIRMQSASTVTTGNWYVYFDDVSLHTALT